MVRKRKKRRILQPYVLLMAVIIPLNFIGISYAYWNDGLDINNSVSTGLIEPLFCDNYSLDIIQGNGELNIGIDDGDTITVDGRVYTDYKAFINYCLKNEGTVPVKYSGQHDEFVNARIVDLSLPSGIIEPEGCIPSGDNNLQLCIHADEEGIYDFEIEIPFQQWNNVEESLLAGSVSD
ncbi:hypothetical protein [Phosphitispora sp. TUW77]|uniref:hypothetical protein n=1 Tax=Phosphitispora sp. TUW77 TaxID=3152361 RepID=UPI003AB50CD4